MSNVSFMKCVSGGFLRTRSEDSRRLRLRSSDLRSLTVPRPLNPSSSDLTRLSPRPWQGVFERTGARSATGNAMDRALPFVVIVCLCAIGTAVVVASNDLVWDVKQVYAALLLVALGVGAEMINYEQVKGSSGSISLIPFAAAGLCAPTWISVAAIALGSGTVQIIYRRHWVKGLFNVAQMAFGLSLAILVYKSAKGTSFLPTDGQSILTVAKSLFLPAALLVTALVLVNSATVSGVVAIAQQRNVFEVWKATTIPTAPFILLTAFLTFYLAWLYSGLGPGGAAALVIPLLGVRQLYRTTLELTRVTEELLDLMVAAIEARDPYTSGHSQRVARASKIIARTIGLKPAEIERVGVAALLHDVGKIDEAFAPILAKEGRLTPQEWEVMKRHPIRSAELVGLLSSLRDVVPAVRHHHENWDGTGYPDGIKAEAIPLASRIIMFADTLDAMTSDRPYRKALTVEEAKAEFVRFRARQFDPTICDRILEPGAWDELYRSYQAEASSETRLKSNMGSR
jgi:HD-GYP domain-containing protein (c-di-GMP phosphodiesterase class II)